MTSQRIDFGDLKARADFGAVLTHYGIVAGRGKQFKIPCPFHEDSRPSCSVNVDERLFNCFACPAEGNVLDFVHRMEARGGEVVSIREAGLKLAEICGLTGTQSGARKAKGGSGTPEAQKGLARPRSAPDVARSGAETPVNKPLGFSLKHLVMHEYLLERASPALIQAFGLGFCEKGIMAGRVVIPIHNAAGELVAYAGRWAGALEELPEGEEKYKLPKGFRKNLELFNLHRVKHCKHLVVVEGYFGAIRLHGLRIPVVSPMGNSISEEQVALLKAHCPALRFVTVMLDGDAPGREASQPVCAGLARHWWTRIMALPEGLQPDTVAEKELEALVGR